jgi:hypothetical protein
MTFTETFEKQTAEKIPKGIEYTDRLPEGEVVQFADVKVRVYTAGTDLTGTMIEGVPTVTDTRITAMIKGGADGTDYKITYLATCSNGTILEDDLLMQVRDI